MQPRRHYIGNNKTKIHKRTQKNKLFLQRYCNRLSEPYKLLLLSLSLRSKRKRRGERENGGGGGLKEKWKFFFQPPPPPASC